MTTETRAPISEAVNSIRRRSVGGLSFRTDGFRVMADRTLSTERVQATGVGERTYHATLAAQYVKPYVETNKFTASNDEQRPGQMRYGAWTSSAISSPTAGAFGL